MKSWDHANAAYWQELCGTAAANSFGFDMSTLDGQNRFDEWYISFYNYLFEYVESLNVEGKRVIEVGLGLGTLSRHIASKTTEYVGIDISTNSCIYVEGTLRQRGFKGKTINQSVFDLDQDLDNKFDIGIAIGSLHHTGNLPEAIKSLERTVRPGGKLLIMVYNEFDLRRIVRKPARTLFRGIQTLFGAETIWQEVDSAMRGLNDSNQKGESAPSTAFASKRFFRALSKQDVTWKVERRNFHDFSNFNRKLTRDRCLGWPAKLLGPDLYAMGEKLIDG